MFAQLFTEGNIMRFLIVAAAVVALTVPAHAETMKNCAAAWEGVAAADKAKTTYAAYSKMCLAKGYTVPTAAAAPAVATGQCKDGTYTMAKSHQGACSSHGGVAKWL